MGNYAKDLSKRFKHVGKGQSRGYCVICGEYGKLVLDHVPPQGSITVTKTEQHLITEVSGMNLERKIKGIRSPNGSKFRTICQTCNGERIGSGDDEVKRVHRAISDQVVAYYAGHSIYPWASVRFDVSKYLRAMTGHILSATSSIECQKEQVSSTYFDPLKSYVMNDDRRVFDTHDFYYWFYPYERHLSAKLVGFFNDGLTSKLSLLSFHPIAFMITEKDKSTYPAQASKLEETSKNLTLNISVSNVKYAPFPFIELEGNQFYMLTDYLCTTSKSLI
ncbi:metal-binding protein [Onishia niordana]|uniref:metal-binding protein n=1 Tax=Onishia niordana TaxID=2508711 RepID=UPI00109F7A44|nr:metal-binding protein [Halomonas niordiana]